MTGRCSRCYGALPDSRQLPAAAMAPVSPVRDRGPTPTRPSRDPDRTTARHASSATRITDLNSSIVVLMENHRNGLGTEGGYIVSMEGHRRAARRGEPGGRSGSIGEFRRRERRGNVVGYPGPAELSTGGGQGEGFTLVASSDAVKKRPNRRQLYDAKRNYLYYNVIHSYCIVIQAFLYQRYQGVDMTRSKPKLANLICLRLDENTLTAIRKSGQNTSDWFRGAARNRIDGERQADTPTGKLEKQIEGLQKEVARLQ